MRDVQWQIAHLRRGGYLDEAETLQRLSGSVNTDAEWGYILSFAAQTDFDYQLSRDQLRALWTAYCFHANLDVDTGSYDSRLRTLWGAIPDGSDLRDIDWHDFEAFDDFMCAYLV